MRSKRLFPFYGLEPTIRRSRVAALEDSFAKRTGTAHAVAVNSGTSALVSALAALEIGPGDEVIVPAYTWYSTVSAVLAVGAVPIVAEVDDSLTLDPADVERKVSPQTRCIVPVHMRGMPARMDALCELARARGLRVLEDVAQAAGGSFDGRALGSIGDAGAFSFQFSKVMTAGEGGMVTTDHSNVYRRTTMYQDSAALPNLGFSVAEWLPGVNLRMSELHAAVLLAQLERLDAIVTRAPRAQAPAEAARPARARRARGRLPARQRRRRRDRNRARVLSLRSELRRAGGRDTRRTTTCPHHGCTTMAHTSRTTTSTCTRTRRGHRSSRSERGRLVAAHGERTRGRSTTQPTPAR